jgi:hypothetical protein
MTDPRDLAPRPARKRSGKSAASTASGTPPAPDETVARQDADATPVAGSEIATTAAPLPALTTAGAPGETAGPDEDDRAPAGETEDAPAPAETITEDADPSAELDRAFVQILVTPELAVRMSRASHHLKQTAYRARFQQTVIGALIDGHIPDPDDPEVVAAISRLIARWRQEELSDRRPSRRLGWHLPLELSGRLDQLVLNLKEQHYRLRPSVTSVLAALIWLELDPDTPGGQVALEASATDFYDRVERPDYTALAA